MRIVKYGLIALIALGGGTAIYQSGYWQQTVPGKASARQNPRGEQPAALVQVKKSHESTFVDTVQAVGTTRARQTIDVVSMVDGQIASVDFSAGDRVEAGATLVTLDDRTQQANLREARVALDEARSAYERAQSLAGQNFATRASVEQARSALERAKAAVDRGEEELADRTIKAPFSGMVGMAKVQQGARIDSSTVIATLDDLAEVEIEFFVPEIYLSRVAVGQAVTARSDAFRDREFTGSVTAIDSRVNPSSRAFAVRANITNPDFTLRAGMFMHISVVLDTRVAVAIPEEAIITESNTTYVYLISDNKAVRRDVTLGTRRDGTVEITSGMDAGETVISSGVQNVDDGRTIEIIEREISAPEQRPRTG